MLYQNHNKESVRGRKDKQASPESVSCHYGPSLMRKLTENKSRARWRLQKRLFDFCDAIVRA